VLVTQFAQCAHVAIRSAPRRRHQDGSVMMAAIVSGPSSQVPYTADTSGFIATNLGARLSVSGAEVQEPGRSGSNAFFPAGSRWPPARLPVRRGSRDMRDDLVLVAWPVCL